MYNVREGILVLVKIAFFKQCQKGQIWDLMGCYERIPN